MDSTKIAKFTPVVEKHAGEEVYHVDNASDDKVADLGESGERRFTDIDEGFDSQVVKRLMRKIDWRLVPVLSAMYAISLIDRTNLASARAANDNYMNTELKLTGKEGGDRYSIITLIFFVPYIIFEMPVSFSLNAFSDGRPLTVYSLRSACASLALVSGWVLQSFSGA